MDEIVAALDDLYSLLGKEIDWCEENFTKEAAVSDQYKLGFIGGLKQAQNLLIDFEIVLVKIPPIERKKND